MSRDMEAKFLCDLDDTRVVEYQVFGCALPQLLCLQKSSVQCQSCDCLVSSAISFCVVYHACKRHACLCNLSIFCVMRTS